MDFLYETRESILSTLGTALVFAMFLSPLPILRKAQKSSQLKSGAMGQSSSQSISPIPYLTMFVNCLFWITYGILLNNWILIISNGFGFIMSCYYNWICLTISEKKEAFLTKCSVALLFYIGGLAWVLFGVDAKNIILHLGFIASCSSVMLFGSPLISLATVIKTKNSEILPGLLGLVSTCCALTWALYGYVLNDRFILVPNCLGFILGLIQCIAKIMYNKPNHKQQQGNVFSLLPTTIPSDQTSQSKK